MNSEVTVAELAQMYDGLLPLKSDQRFIFKQLIESIAYCERLGSTAWSITLAKWGFRLNVGQVEVMTCGFTYFQDENEPEGDGELEVLLRTFVAGGDALSKIKTDSSVESIGEGNYASVGARHWCYARSFVAANSEAGPSDPSRDDFGVQLLLLGANRDKYLHLACHTSSGKLRQKSNFARSHCPALYALAQSLTSEGKAKPTSDVSMARLPSATTAEAREEDVEPGFVYLLIN
jgi:hypothetical protein